MGLSVFHHIATCRQESECFRQRDGKPQVAVAQQGGQDDVTRHTHKDSQSVSSVATM